MGEEHRRVRIRKTAPSRAQRVMVPAALAALALAALAIAVLAAGVLMGILPYPGR